MNSLGFSFDYWSKTLIFHYYTHLLDHHATKSQEDNYSLLHCHLESQ